MNGLHEMDMGLDGSGVHINGLSSLGIFFIGSIQFILESLLGVRVTINLDCLSLTCEQNWFSVHLPALLGP